MAHLEKKTEQDAAYHCLLAAAEKYALSLFYSPNNPQVCPVILWLHQALWTSTVHDSFGPV